MELFEQITLFAAAAFLIIMGTISTVSGTARVASMIVFKTIPTTLGVCLAVLALKSAGVI